MLFYSLAGREARAICLGPTLENVSPTYTFHGSSGGYDVYDAAEHIQSASIQIRSRANLGPCNYYVVLNAGLSGNSSQRKMGRGSDRLDYNIYTTASKSNVIREFGVAGTSERISGVFSSLIGGFQTANHDFYWTVTPQQVFEATGVSFGDASLTLQLYAELALGIYTNTDSETISFYATPDSSVNLSLVNTGAPFDSADVSQSINFGDMMSGASLSYDTVIRSNDGYTVKFQSQNSQGLAHTNPLLTYRVPYSMTFGGNSVNLTSGTQVQAASSTAVTPASGARFATTFTLGTLTGAEAAGNYSDVLTVTISAN